MRQSINNEGEAIQAFTTVGEGQVLTMTGSTVASVAIPAGVTCIKVQADVQDIVFSFANSVITIDTNTAPNKVFVGGTEMFGVPLIKRTIYANGTSGGRLRITYGSLE